MILPARVKIESDITGTCGMNIPGLLACRVEKSLNRLAGAVRKWHSITICEHAKVPNLPIGKSKQGNE